MRQITQVNKLADKSKTHEIRNLSNGYVVTSGASGKQYFVKLEPIASCTCKWAEYQPEGSPVACSHVMKVRAFVAKENGYVAKFRPIDENTKHLHRMVETIGNGVKLTLRKA